MGQPNAPQARTLQLSLAADGWGALWADLILWMKKLRGLMSKRCLSTLNVDTSNSLPNHLKKEGEVIIKVQSATVLSLGVVLAGTDKRCRHRAQTEVLCCNLEL